MVGKKPQATMAGSTDHRYFIQLNDFSVAVLRTSGPKNASVIEAYRDASLDDEEGVKAAIAIARPENAESPTPATCSIHPEQSLTYVATAEEAAKHNTAAAISTFLTEHASFDGASAEWTTVYADSGRTVDKSSKTPWLGVVANATKKSQLLSKLEGWGLKAERVESTALSLCGAVQGTLAASNTKDSVILWEVGRTTSDLLLVSTRGVEGSRRIAFGFERIAEAILQEIKLKFKGAAAKLFFNNRYDFSAAGPKIAQQIADLLAADVSKLVSQRSPGPRKFVLAGFPSKQDWFASALAPGLGLELFDINVEPWLKKSGLNAENKSDLEKLSPAWLGVFGLAAGHSGQNVETSPAWHPIWTATPADTAKPEPAKQTSAPKSVASESKPAAAAVASGSNPDTGRKKQQSLSPTSGTTGQSGTTQAPTKSPSLPAGVRIANPDAMGLSKDTQEEAKRKKSQWIRNLAVAAGVLGLVGAGYVYFQNVEQQKQAAETARQVAEQQAAANERARFEAEQKARAEAAARQRAEEEMAARTAAAETARIKAEEAARANQLERERLLNARGTVQIESVPSGATVSIANFGSQLSPATFKDLRLGRYSATVDLEGYDSSAIEFTIDDEQVINPGPVRLVRHTGKLEITTKPVGVHYEVKPASEGAFTTAMQSRMGITPHTLGSLPTDEYIVTLEREGSPTITRRVKIEHNATTTVFENLAVGSVRITSNPPGASVFGKDDILLGITPLEIEGVAAGETNYTIEHPDYNPVTLTGNVQVGAVTDLSTTLEPIQVLARISELDRKPTPTRRVEPNLVDPKRFVGHNAIISLVVNEEGIPEDVEIKQASDPEFGQLCLEAVRQWEFKPGRIGRTPVATKVQIPFTID